MNQTQNRDAGRRIETEKTFAYVCPAIANIDLYTGALGDRTERTHTHNNEWFTVTISIARCVWPICFVFGVWLVLFRGMSSAFCRLSRLLLSFHARNELEIVFTSWRRVRFCEYRSVCKLRRCATNANANAYANVNCVAWCLPHNVDARPMWCDVWGNGINTPSASSVTRALSAKHRTMFLRTGDDVGGWTNNNKNRLAAPNPNTRRTHCAHSHTGRRAPVPCPRVGCYEILGLWEISTYAQVGLPSRRTDRNMRSQVDKFDS